MVKDIKVSQHKATGKWYATCKTKFGLVTKWGQTDIEASKNLKKYVEKRGETWPAVERVE